MISLGTSFPVGVLFSSSSYFTSSGDSLRFILTEFDWVGYKPNCGGRPLSLWPRSLGIRISKGEATVSLILGSFYHGKTQSQTQSQCGRDLARFPERKEQVRGLPRTLTTVTGFCPQSPEPFLLFRVLLYNRSGPGTSYVVEVGLEFLIRLP